jgi:hypothetical protein
MEISTSNQSAIIVSISGDGLIESLVFSMDSE